MFKAARPQRSLPSAKWRKTDSETWHAAPTMRRMRHRHLLRLLSPAVLFSVLAAATPAHAADPDTLDQWARWGGTPREATVRSLDFIGPLLFAGTEAEGVYSSPTSVGLWTQRNGGLDTVPSKAVRQVKTAPDGQVYAATSAGLFRSPAGQGGWQPVGQGTGARKLAMGGIQSIMFNGPTGTDMTVAVSGAGGAGVYYSSDAGEHWDRASGMANPENVYYLTSGPLQVPMYAAADNGVYSSLDFGRSWILTSDGIPPGSTTLRVAVSPTNPKDLYASTSGSVYYSKTGGITWDEIDGSDDQRLPSGGKRAFLLTPDLSGKFGPARMLVGTDKGVYATIDNGTHWKPMSPTTFQPDASTPMVDRQVQSLSLGFTTPVIMAGTQGFGVFNLPVLPLGGGAPTITPASGLAAGTELKISNLDETNGNLSLRRHMGFTGTKPYFYAYQWFKCSTPGSASCTVPIPGATGPSYVIPNADAAETDHYAVKVTARNVVSPAPITVTSNLTTGTVANLPGANPKPKSGGGLAMTQSPAGQPYWDTTLTITPGIWATEAAQSTPITVDSFKYRWERCDGNAANCKAIIGATGASLKVATDDIGGKIRGFVSAKKGSATSDFFLAGTTNTILNRFPTNTVKPQIVGPAYTGVKLSSSAGGWTGFDMTYERRWLRCEADGLGCNPIAFPAETGTTYTVKAADLGKRLQLEVKAIAKDPNQNRITTVLSATTAVITDPPPPVVEVVPGGPLPSGSDAVPSGGPGVGQVQPQGPAPLVLTLVTPKKVKAGVQLKAPKTVAGFTKVSYQWLRGGKKIKKATGRAYRLTKADRGKKISCKITLTPAGGGAKVIITTAPVKVPKK